MKLVAVIPRHLCLGSQESPVCGKLSLEQSSGRDSFHPSPSRIDQGNRQTRGCTPISGLGIDAQAYSLPKAFGKEPFEVGPAATMTHCRWDSQFSSPRFRPHLGLSLGFLPSVLYFCLLFLPFLPYHTAGRKTNMELLAI